MGRKAYLVVLCWLSIGADSKTVNSSTVNDNVSAASGLQFQASTPFRIYASGAPYSAFTFHVPSAVEPAKAGSQLVPVKEESLVIHKQNGYLKDSYGNKFAGNPQTIAYKTMFPQQYVRLQDLPLHLSQPLVAAPGYHFSGSLPYASYGSPHRLSSFQAATPTPIVHFNNPSHGQVYAENIRSFAPTHGRYTVPGSPQQQSTNSRSVYANKFSPQYHHNLPSGPKFQRLQEAPKPKSNDNNHRVNQKVIYSTKQNLEKELQSAPAKQIITTYNNGQKTTVAIDTNPPIPLLDLDLLQPLTFANPIVPQVQHFLPKITYKLPKVETNNHHNEFVVQKTKYYDTGVIKSDPEDEESNDDKPRHDPRNHLSRNEPLPKKPTNDVKSTDDEEPSIRVNGNRGGPEFSYEINSPNFKETYNEQVISYDKKTDKEPVHFSYNEKTEAKPVSYSFTSSSKEPIKSVHYEVHNEGPKQVIYNFKPENEPVLQNEHIGQNIPENSRESESSGESDESVEGRPRHNSGHDEYEEIREVIPTPTHLLKPEHRQEDYQLDQKEHDNHQKQIHDTDEYQQNHHRPEHIENEAKHRAINKEHYRNVNPQNEGYNQKTQHINQEHRHIPQKSKQQYHHPTPEHTPRENYHYVPEHKHNDYQEKPKEVHNVPNDYIRSSPSPQYSLPIIVPVRNIAPSVQTLTPQYHEEDIHILPAEPSSEPIIVAQHHGQDSKNQHHHHPERINKVRDHPQGNNQDHQKSQHPHSQNQYNEGAHPHVVEKSRKIIIQEETPEEMHSLREQMVSEMIDHQNNNDEDFENAYKQSAYGFPAYDREDDDAEKEIYNPESYGVPHEEFDIENSPFQQYQEEGDDFPKSARLSYKDGRDDTKEDYYLDYSVKKPESFLDRHKSKVAYYKMYKKQKPKIFFAEEPKKKKSEKLVNDPSIFEYQPYQKPKQKNYFAKYRQAPVFGYNYAKEAPKDSFAHGSGHIRRSKTLFVEPQFQYGFEPISLPSLLDSELSAMASNNSPESEKPATRKKVYKENWYIKKTSTSGNKPAS